MDGSASWKGEACGLAYLIFKANVLSVLSVFHVWNLRLMSFWCHSFSSTNHDLIFLMTKELVTFVGPDCALMPLVRAPASPVAKVGFLYTVATCCI